MASYPNEEDELKQFMLLYAQALQLALAEGAQGLERKREGTRIDCPTVQRTRKSVTQVYRELGKGYFRRAFRMSYRTFCRLYRLLEDDLKRESGTKRFEPGYVDRSSNGPVLLTVRLAAAIRFFAGGELWRPVARFLSGTATEYAVCLFS